MKQPVSLSVSNLSWSLPHNNQEILKSVSFDLEKCKILGVVDQMELVSQLFLDCSIDI